MALQLVPVGLLVLTAGSFFSARAAFKNRERIAGRHLERARSSSLTWSIIGFLVGGIIPGVFNILLYMRIGSIMVKRRPDDPNTAYLLPSPSKGLFLGRYLGWLVAYLVVLYIGYTSLPQGLGSVSGWLSPIFGTHFNTLVVAVYLVFGNPLTYLPLLQAWAIVGVIGGLIAGGSVRRGASVGLTAFLSTLGAMGLAALAIFRTFSFAALSNIPPTPPGFSLPSVTSGPVASDTIPILLQASSPTDIAIIQNLAIILLRNALLALAVVTISGRAGCLIWQGGMFLGRHIRKAQREAPTQTITTSPDAKTIKVGIMLALLAVGSLALSASNTTPIAIRQAPPSGPYSQNIAVGLDMLGAPNASLRMTNLDLASRSLVLNSDYDSSNFTAFIINNNYPEAFGTGPQTALLRLFSEPVLLASYTGSLASATPKADRVAAQFGQALRTTFSRALALQLGSEAFAVYSPSPSLTNSQALRKVLAALPSTSFASLVNASRIENEHYFAMLGVLPSLSGISTNGFSVLLDAKFSRTYFKEGPHQFSLKALLGFQGNIPSDPGANASLVSLTFQRGTVLYSPLLSNPYYDNSTSAYYLDVTTTSATDLYASFAYPFAPNVVIRKTVVPDSGTVGSARTVTARVLNLDTVTVESLNFTDPEASDSYKKTLTLSPNGNQTLRLTNFTGGDARTLAYSVTPESSGTYVLSPSIVEFLWTATNGTKIRYSIRTEEIVLTSSSGPVTQFDATLTDLWPYSILLVILFLLTPVLKLVGHFRSVRRNRRKRIETNY